MVSEVQTTIFTLSKDFIVPFPSLSFSQEFSKLNLNLWMVLLCVLALHFLRQVFRYYKFLTSEEIIPLRMHLSFFKHILPSFLFSLLTGLCFIDFSHLTQDISANDAIRRLHKLPYRSKLHTYYSDMQGYKDQNFLIAIDSDEKVAAFRKVFLNFMCQRIQNGSLQRVVKEGVQEWVQKGTVDMIDITMLLERISLCSLYDMDPKEMFTLEEQRKRAETYYNTTKFVVYDSYRPAGYFFALLKYFTGRDMDPSRRKLIKEITKIWDDLYDRQAKMMKYNDKCILSAFQQDPITATLSPGFIKANAFGAVVGGQFLTSISNITGLLHSISEGDLPVDEYKVHWILRLISDWSPIGNVLRSHCGFVVNIPAAGNSKELNRPFSLGARQCPGRGLVLEVYGCILEELSNHKVTAEGLENVDEVPSVWSFVNQGLKFKIESL